ncbi:MAG: cupin domain-containing protein [Myxococcota bacterium]
MTEEDDELRGALASLLDGAEGAALGLDPSAAPPSGLKARLLGGLARTSRFARFEGAVATLLEIPLERARVVLAALDDPKVWVRELPMAEFFWVERGPALQNAVCGFVRVDRGTTFPEHEHLGRERILMLQGAMIDGVSGTRYGPGDLVENAAKSEHHYVAEAGGVDMLHLVVTEVGYRFGEVIAGPREPADY